MKISSKNIDRLKLDSIKFSKFWSGDKKKELKMHNIHAYPAKFPSFVVTRSIKYAKHRNKKVKVIADIFCGCGTTGLEAMINGIDFWGCDLNPVATLIARVKSQRYSQTKIRKYSNDILLAYENGRKINKNIIEENERIKYWFNEKEITDLYKLLSIIRELVKDKKYQNYYLLAFSNILKGTSKWLTKSIKPQIDPQKKIANVIDLFKKQLNFMESAVLEVDKNEGKNKSKIITGNFTKLKFKKPFTDMVVTSPPYATSYEYADLHQLSVLWLKYAQDYRDLRDGSIGSLYKHNLLRADIEKNLNSVGLDVFNRLYSKDKHRATSVARYFIDLDKTIINIKKILRKNGILIMVIGNTEYKGIEVNNTKYVIKSLIKNNFSEINLYKRKVSSKILTPYRDKEGKFSSNSLNRKVYGHEFVISATK